MYRQDAFQPQIPYRVCGKFSVIAAFLKRTIEVTVPCVVNFSAIEAFLKEPRREKRGMRGGARRFFPLKVCARVWENKRIGSIFKGDTEAKRRYAQSTTEVFFRGVRPAHVWENIISYSLSF